MRTFTLIAATLFCGLVSAYPTNFGASADLSLRDCSAEAATYDFSRRAKRGHDKRSYYLTMKNTTCVLSPETPLDNHIANPPFRSDVTEGQTGLPFTMDIGVLDITTCQPLPNVMVEIWSANALGNYGQTFLRGATMSEANGIAEFQTIFPGYTSGAANHLNVMVHTGSAQSSPVTHVGQLFFTDKWTTIIEMTSPYNQNTHVRTTDLDDSNYMAANRAGYSPVVDILSIQDDWPTGIIGYITVGVNPHVTV